MLHLSTTNKRDLINKEKSEKEEEMDTLSGQSEQNFKIQYM